MLVYKSTFDNIKNVDGNFPIEDQYFASSDETIVADGITRDPIGLPDFELLYKKRCLLKNIQIHQVLIWPLKKYVIHFL